MLRRTLWKPHLTTQNPPGFGPLGFDRPPGTNHCASKWNLGPLCCGVKLHGWLDRISERRGRTARCGLLRNLTLG